MRTSLVNFRLSSFMIAKPLPHKLRALLAATLAASCFGPLASSADTPQGPPPQTEPQTEQTEPSEKKGTKGTESDDAKTVRSAVITAFSVDKLDNETLGQLEKSLDSLDLPAGIREQILDTIRKSKIGQLPAAEKRPTDKEKAKGQGDDAAKRKGEASGETDEQQRNRQRAWERVERAQREADEAQARARKLREETQREMEMGQEGPARPGEKGMPGPGQPGTGQPGTGQPGTGQPGTGQPGTGQPGTGPRERFRIEMRGPFGDRGRGRGAAEADFEIGLMLESRENGVLGVAAVPNDSPAAKAGARPGDIILKADGRDVTRPEELQESVRAAGRENRNLQLFLRRGGDEVTIDVRPRPRPRIEVYRLDGPMGAPPQGMPGFPPSQFPPGMFPGMGPQSMGQMPGIGQMPGMGQPAPWQGEIEQLRQELRQLREELNRLRGDVGAVPPPGSTNPNPGNDQRPNPPPAPQPQPPIDL
jgi:hypothetical protein